MCYSLQFFNFHCSLILSTSYSFHIFSPFVAGGGKTPAERIRFIQQHGMNFKKKKDGYAVLVRNSVLVPRPVDLEIEVKN